MTSLSPPHTSLNVQRKHQISPTPSSRVLRSSKLPRTQTIQGHSLSNASTRQTRKRPSKVGTKIHKQRPSKIPHTVHQQRLDEVELRKANIALWVLQTIAETNLNCRCNVLRANEATDLRLNQYREDAEIRAINVREHRVLRHAQFDDRRRLRMLEIEEVHHRASHPHVPQSGQAF
jgi:hypothetical protein